MTNSADKRDRLTEDTSCRLSPEQKKRLKQAAQLLGIKPSDLMREAVMSRCDAVLRHKRDPRAALAGIIGAINIPTDVARPTSVQTVETTTGGESSHDPG